MALLLWGVCVPSFGQGLGGFEVDWDYVAEESHAIAEEMIRRFELPVELPPVERWGQSLALIERTLREGRVEDVGRLAPYVRRAYAELLREPRLVPYVDWLRQRVDYFEVAEEFLKPPEPPSRPPEGERPAPPPRRPEIEDAGTWNERLEPRAAPARAENLVPRLKAIFTAEGVPAELVWVAEVESSFNPAARSPVGAVGLYQFMPRTAEHLGLRLAPEDERLHPEKNARAAARYLRALHGRFDDWPLSLAAYNGGQGRVGGLIRQHGNSFEAISAHLPTETRMYVPKVRATVLRREGVDIRTLPPPRVSE